MNRELMYTVEEYNSTSSFFLAIEWNANIMAGTKSGYLKTWDESHVLGMAEQLDGRDLGLQNEMTISALNCLNSGCYMK